MATKRDLVEAHAFSRRRLVTAFVSGAPGGREVEPVRPGRTIVGGVALSVLLVAAAAITGVFSDRPDSDWDAPGLVISKELGAAYVILDEDLADDELPELRPVLNITSAQLILGAEGLEPRIVAQDVLETRPVGADLGILDAPASLPDPAALVDTGWSACTGDGLGLAVAVQDPPTVAPSAATDAVLVEVKGGSSAGLWLVATAPDTGAEPAQAHRYLLPAGSSERTDAFLREVGLGSGSAQALRVPREWLELFPRGGDLSEETFGLEELGEAAPDQPDGVRVGDYATASDGSGLLVDDDGALQPLTPFAAALWRTLDVSPDRGRRPAEKDLDGASAPPAYDAARWPAGALTPVAGQACALLEADAERPPQVRLAGSPEGEASAETLLDRGQRSVHVAPGAGAYVVSGEWGEVAPAEGGRRFVVDQKGRVDALVGEDTPFLLGYAEHPAPLVPSSWLDLFAPGVALSQEAALCPPGSSSEDGSCA
ncbi:type VII secretion protein EccB [uncultured Nocardioides sp.]|uniref:type VII secretion protein EccB n=1 Tax=uncultured Nocardioides sp. TaxID=198441 RepID=UPI002638AA15|nr:type VII secretion protein EccB [uncultured Nocardioides sp.]